MFFLELLLVGLAWGSMYALMALGLTLVYGLLRILHVAHAGVFTLGAYIGVVVANWTGSMGMALVSAILAASVAGPVIYRLLYEPILKQPPYVPLIASIGLLIAMEDGFRLVFGPYGISFNHNPWFVSSYELVDGLAVNVVQITITLTAVALFGALAIFFTLTRMGVAWRAIVTEPQMAESFGINPIKVRYLSFAISSAIAAIAGVLVAVINNLVEPGMGAVISYKGLAIIVLGGLGNIQGALIASLILGVAESFGTIYLGQLLDRDAIAFLVLIAVLMIRPQGLFGKA